MLSLNNAFRELHPTSSFTKKKCIPQQRSRSHKMDISRQTQTRTSGFAPYDTCLFFVRPGCFHQIHIFHKHTQSNQFVVSSSEHMLFRQTQKATKLPAPREDSRLALALTQPSLEVQPTCTGQIPSSPTKLNCTRAPITKRSIAKSTCKSLLSPHKDFPRSYSATKKPLSHETKLLPNSESSLFTGHLQR